MIIFGLTGGIASGKSFVARLLAERGAIVLDADRYAHAVLQEPEVIEELIARWGETILAADGSVERSTIARRVFAEGETATTERRFLEQLVHPRVRQRLQVALEEARNQLAPAAVLDVPLLIEAGWGEQCDVVLFVQTPLAIRQQRAAQRGWSAEELERRESSQMPMEEKQAKAGAIIPGTDEAAARAAIEAVWTQWVDGDAALSGINDP